MSNYLVIIAIRDSVIYSLSLLLQLPQLLLIAHDKPYIRCAALWGDISFARRRNVRLASEAKRRSRSHMCVIPFDNNNTLGVWDGKLTARQH